MSAIRIRARTNTVAGDETLPNSDVIGGLLINEFCFNTTDPYAIWVEIYNPSNYSTNLTHYEIWDNMVNMPYPGGATDLILNESIMNTTILGPSKYAIMCYDKETFLFYWDVPEDVIVFENWRIYYWAPLSRIFLILPFSDTIEGYSQLPLNHSWARYNDAHEIHSFYDDYNFTDYFYGETNPTPGYENNKARKIPNQDDGSLFIIVGITGVVIAVVVLSGIAVWRKNSKLKKEERNLERKDDETNLK